METLPLKDTDFVYILGTGSRWKNNEIRYSLRSLTQYVPHRRVIIIGHKSDWMTKVLHIPAVDDQENKMQNAIQKIRIACQIEGLSQEFILMNDDFFFLKEHQKIETFTNGTLAKMRDDHKTQAGYYFYAIKNTLDLLQQAGIKEPLNYEHHRPMRIDKTKFLTMVDALNWKKEIYIFRSIYGNIYGVPAIDKPDCKIFSFNHLSKIERGDIISTDNPVVMTKKFQTWIQNKYPTRSKYETY